MTIRCIVVLLTLLITAPAIAQPNSTTDRLINDSPSMLDFGVFRLESYLRHTYGGDISAQFDWKRNLIVIRRHVMMEPDDDQDIERNCRSWLSQIRAGALVDGSTGKLLGDPHSKYAGFFGHIGYNKTISGVDEDEVLPLIDHLFSLESNFWRLGDDRSATPEIKCTGELLSSTYSISRGWP